MLTFSRARWAAFVLLLLGPAVAFAAEGDASDLLERQAWQEQSFGLSLRPPRGTTVSPLPTQDGLVRFVFDEAALDVLVKKSDEPIELDKVYTMAIGQMGVVQPHAVLIDEVELDLAPLSGRLVYFRLPGNNNQKWVQAQAFVPIADRVFVMLRMEVPAERLDAVRPAFEASIKTLDVGDPDALDAHRQSMIERGQALIANLSPQRVHELLEPERWMRVVTEKDNRDVGYMRITERRDTVMDAPGVRVDVQSRTLEKKSAHDTVSNFFVSDDGQHEYWSIRSTVRPRSGDALPALSDEMRLASASRAETGLRQEEMLTVTIETPTGLKHREWQVPEQAYISMAHAYMVGRLLKDHVGEELAFYGYLSDKKKISLRLYSVEPMGDGYRVLFRPGPELPEQTMLYAADGTLLEATLPGGVRMEPTTRSELSRTWRWDD